MLEGILWDNETEIQIYKSIVRNVINYTWVGSMELKSEVMIKIVLTTYEFFEKISKSPKLQEFKSEKSIYNI